MKNDNATIPVRPARPRGLALYLDASLKLFAGFLLATMLACSNGGSDDNPVASSAAAAAAAAESASSGTGGTTTPPTSGTAPPPTGGTTTPPTSGTTTPPTGGTTTPPQTSTPPRTYPMSFLPSPSGTVAGYEVSLGQSTGSYDTFIDLPLNSITVSNGTWTHDLTLDADRDYFIVLRAYNAGGMSVNSNEIRVAALVSNATGGSSGGGSSSAQASTAASIAGPLAAVQASPGSTSLGRPASRSQLADAEEPSQERARLGDSMTSLDFDGSGEHLVSTVSAPLGTVDTFSVSVWARPVLDSAERRTMLDLRGEADSNANRLTVAVVNSTDVELTLHDSSGAVLHQARFAEALLDGEWQNVAVVFDAGRDLEPRFYVDAEQQIAAASHSAEGAWAMSDSPRRVFLGADASGEGHSWRGQLGHVGVWNTALSELAMLEVSAMGHGMDLRNPGIDYRGQVALLHYWRLGDESNGIGFDYAVAGVPVDLDDESAGIDGNDIVEEAPAAMQVVDSR
jgi:hypothetical protein